MPKVDEQLGHHGVPAHRARQAHPAAGEFLGHRGVALRGHLGLAPRLGDRQAEDAELLHLPDQLLRVGVGVLKLAHDRPDLAVHELAHQRDDGGFLVGQPIHHDPASLCSR